MREKKSLGIPFFACIGVLAFFLTVGAQLYLKGVPVSQDSVAQAKPVEVVQAPKAELPTEEETEAPAPTMQATETLSSDLDEELVPRPKFELSGTVLSKAGKRIAGADLRIYFVQGDQERELTRLLSEVDGHFESDLGSLSSLSTESLLAGTIELQVICKDFLPVRQRIEPMQSSVDSTIEIELSPGHNLRGRILNSLGEPVAGSTVDLYLDCPPGTVRSDAKRADTTDRHGEYLFGWKSNQALRFIDAEHPSFGKATIALNKLPATEDQVLEDIKLDAGGTLSGIVRCEHGGDLLPGVRIDVHPMSSVKNGKRKWTFTGSDGSFHLSGLEPGEYKLWVEGASQPIGYWPTGSQDIELDVDLVRLVVSVRDSLGEPLPGQKVQFVNLAGDRSAPLIKTASDVAKGQEALAVFSPAVSSEFHDGVRVESSSVALRATALSVPTYEELITIPEDACRVDHTLTLLTGKDLGTLRIQVRDAEGDPVLNPVISLSSMHSGEAISNMLDREQSPEVWLSSLAPGEYALRIEPPNAQRPDNMLLGLAPEQPVQVRRGRETLIELQAATGGRIRLRVDLEEVPGVEPLDYPTVRANATIALATSKKPLHEAAVFEVEQRGSRTSELPVRTSCTSYDVLAPGQYRLRVTCDGFETGELTLEVKPDQVTEARVLLSPW